MTLVNDDFVTGDVLKAAQLSLAKSSKHLKQAPKQQFATWGHFWGHLICLDIAEGLWFLTQIKLFDSPRHQSKKTNPSIDHIRLLGGFSFYLETRQNNWPPGF